MIKISLIDLFNNLLLLKKNIKIMKNIKKIKNLNYKLNF